MFDVFSRGIESLDRQDGGLGVGLTIAKAVGRDPRRPVEAFSEGLGKGSTFTIRLPLQQPAPAKREPSEADPATHVSRRRILVADDNRDAAEGLAMLLRMDGHDVAVVHDGQAALAAFAEMRPELAFIDIGMPKVNGYDVARRVRRAADGRTVTLIALTGWGQDSDKVKALAAGFDHHFTKPVSPEAIGTLLARA